MHDSIREPNAICDASRNNFLLPDIVLACRCVVSDAILKEAADVRVADAIRVMFNDAIHVCLLEVLPSLGTFEVLGICTGCRVANKWECWKYDFQLFCWNHDQLAIFINIRKTVRSNRFSRFS